MGLAVISLVIIGLLLLTSRLAVVYSSELFSSSAEILAEVAEDFRRAAVNPGGHGAGCGESLYNFFLEVVKTHLSIKKVLLERFATKRKVDRFKQTVNRSHISVSPIPIRPSKRDFVLLAAGVPPFHYHNVAYRQAHRNAVSLCISMFPAASISTCPRSSACMARAACR